MQLLCRFKTPDMREMAISQCSVLLSELKRAKPPAARDIYDLRSFRSSIEEKTKHLCELGFTLHMAQVEPDEAVSFYKRNSIHSDPEVSLFILLEKLHYHDFMDRWIREYDAAKEKGVKIRPLLVKIRQYIDEESRLPDYYY